MAFFSHLLEILFCFELLVDSGTTSVGGEGGGGVGVWEWRIIGSIPDWVKSTAYIVSAHHEQHPNDHVTWSPLPSPTLAVTPTRRSMEQLIVINHLSQSLSSQQFLPVCLRLDSFGYACLVRIRYWYTNNIGMLVYLALRSPVWVCTRSQQT